MGGGSLELREPAQLQSPATAREGAERTHGGLAGPGAPGEEAALSAPSKGRGKPPSAPFPIHVHVAAGRGAETTELRLVTPGGTNPLPVGLSAKLRPCLLSSKHPAG